MILISSSINEIWNKLIEEFICSSILDKYLGRTVAMIRNCELIITEPDFTEKKK